MSDADLRAVLEWLDPLTRDALRRVLIHDQADRGAVSVPAQGPWGVFDC